MDYEKLYKEALKRAKEYHDVDTDNELNVYAKGTMEYIFPELAESDDEKIRKYIINFVEVNKEVNLSTTDADRMLAWLEKQGEQKPIEGTFINIDDVREHFINEVYRVLDADPTNDRANQIINAFDTLPTTDIQRKPVVTDKGGQVSHTDIDTSDFKDVLADIIVSSQGLCTYTACKDVAERETPLLLSKLKFEQKPVEWSEEDEDIIYAIESAFNILTAPEAGIGLDEVKGVKIDKILSWLKSLRPQNRQEFKIEKGNWYRCVQAAKKATDDLAYALQNGIDYYAPDDNAILDRYGYRWDLTKRTQSWINEHFAPIPQKQ